MSAPNEKVSRWTHFRAWLGRQSRGHRKDTIAIFVLAIAGIVMTLGIFTQQKASLPGWLPRRRLPPGRASRSTSPGSKSARSPRSSSRTVTRWWGWTSSRSTCS